MATIRSFNQTMNVQTDAGQTSATGLEVYKDGQSVYASHLANIETVGYMHSFISFVTNGFFGTQVRGVEMPSFDTDMRGPLSTTQRSLDLASDGDGFLIVDTSGSTDDLTPAQHGMKTTGHFQLDRNGFLYDEAGNYLLGAKMEEGEGGQMHIPQFSLLGHLQRIQIPLTPSVTDPTTEIEMLGSLPADKITVGSEKENAVDIFDSLGVAHQLRFQWKKLDAPLLWRLTVSDCEDVDITKDDASGASWSKSDPQGGIIVSFDEDGHYRGFLEPDDEACVAWQTAQDSRLGAEKMLENAKRIALSDPDITKETFKSQLDALAGQLYEAGSDELEGALAMNSAMDSAWNTGIQEALIAGDSQKESLIAAEMASFETMHALFSADAPVPKVHIEEWKDHLGNVLGSAPSTINFKLDSMLVAGDEFQIRSPRQNGSGSTSFQSISVTTDGFIALDFANQPSKKIWVVPFISYPNNNGFLQDSRNVLRPTYACGESYILAPPTTANLGGLRSQMVVTSNVNPQKTLLKAHQMAEASRENATLYKMAMELNGYLLQIFGQI